MRNLLGRLNARPADDLARIAAVWGVQLSGTGGPGYRHRQVGQLYRVLTDPRAVRDVWERLTAEERSIVRLLALGRSERGEEVTPTVPEIATALGVADAEAHRIAAGLYRAGILAREGDDAALPEGAVPRLFLPRELAQLFRRVQDEIEAGDLGGTPLRALLELLDDAELEEAATIWGIKVIPGLRRREDLSRQVLHQIAAGRIDGVAAKRRADARAIWERVRHEPAGRPVPLAEAARAAGLAPGDTRHDRRLREALAELETALLVWHSYRPDGSRWLFVPSEIRVPRAVPPPSSPLPDPLPAEAVDTPPWRHPAALAWDLLTVLRALTSPDAPRPDHGGAFPRPWLRQLNGRLWHAGEEAPPAGYVPFLVTLAEAEGLIHRPDDHDQTVAATAVLRSWRDRDFVDQIDRLRERWLTAPEWVEGRERESVVVWGADWRGFRRRLLALLDDPALAGWYPLDGFAAWAAVRDPDLLGPSFTAATARRAGDEDDDPAGRRRAAVAAAVAVELETAAVWFGLVDVVGAGRKRVVRRRPVEPVASADERQRSADPPLEVSSDGIVRLRRPSPVRIWSLSAFADLERLGPECLYRLSAEGTARALAAGFDLDQVVGFLARQSGDALPPEVVGQLRGWAKGYGRVRLRRAIVLTPDDPSTLPALREAIAAAGLAVAPLGDRALLVEPAPDTMADESDAALTALLRTAGHAPHWGTKSRVESRETHEC